jgi:hypothetical protein
MPANMMTTIATHTRFSMRIDESTPLLPSSAPSLRALSHSWIDDGEERQREHAAGHENAPDAVVDDPADQRQVVLEIVRGVERHGLPPGHRYGCRNTLTSSNATTAITAAISVRSRRWCVSREVLASAQTTTHPPPAVSRRRRTGTAARPRSTRRALVQPAAPALHVADQWMPTRFTPRRRPPRCKRPHASATPRRRLNSHGSLSQPEPHGGCRSAAFQWTVAGGCASVSPSKMPREPALRVPWRWMIAIGELPRARGAARAPS